MQIMDILELLKTNKSIVILTPNKGECKLVKDRLMYFITDKNYTVDVIDSTTIKFNGSQIKFVTPETIYKYTYATTIIVVFPITIPEYVLKSLHPINLIYSYSEVK